MSSQFPLSLNQFEQERIHDGNQVFRMQWLDILSSSWCAQEVLEPQFGLVRLVTPTDSGYRAAIIRPME